MYISLKHSIWYKPQYSRSQPLRNCWPSLLWDTVFAELQCYYIGKHEFKSNSFISPYYPHLFHQQESTQSKIIQLQFIAICLLSITKGLIFRRADLYRLKHRTVFTITFEDTYCEKSAGNDTSEQTSASQRQCNLKNFVLSFFSLKFSSSNYTCAIHIFQVK